MVRSGPMSERRADVHASTAAVLLAMALVVLDAGFVNVALPTISKSLQAPPSQAILVVSAYQAALLIGLLPCAQIASRFGHSRLFIAGLAMFGIASIACAFSVNLPMLVAARAVQGLGGAAIMALGIALLRSVFGAEGLGRAIGWNALTVALCSAVAPLLGSLVFSRAPWPMLFLIKLPICALALIASWRLPKSEAIEAPIDTTAIALHASATAMIFGAAAIAIGKPALAVFLTSVAVAFAWVLVRRDRTRSEPLWALDLLAQRPFRVSVGASICCFTAQSAGLIALPFHLQSVLGSGPAVVGLVLACWPVTVALTSTVANRLADRFGSALLCVAGSLALTAGLMFSAMSQPSNGILAIIVGSVLSGLGFGLFQVPNNRTLFLAAPAHRAAAAGGMQGTARLMGQMLGAVVMSYIFACVPDTIAPRIGFAIGSMFAIAAALVSAREVQSLSRFRRSAAEAKSGVHVV